MTPSTNRSVAIDFFRGLALVVIMLDHMPGSLLSHVTLHNYAFCDAAEVFVFVGGYSVAAAYMAIGRRQSESAAAKRFFKRGWEIYRAFLVTAALMLALGMLFHGLQLDTASVDSTEAVNFLRQPFAELIDIASLRRQPFLSSVLPMYAIFAFSAPLILTVAQRMPWLVFAMSVVIWFFAPELAVGLPSAYQEGWAFNPFAWQLMFVGGALCRLYPVTEAFMKSEHGRTITKVAVGLTLSFAFWQLFIAGISPGYEKQNLAIQRLVNFAVLAWLATWITHQGWTAKLSRHLPALVRVGQHSLPCFIAGAGISVSVDALSRPFHDVPHWASGAVIDSTAIVLLLGIATIAATLKRRAAQRTSAPTPPFTGVVARAATHAIPGAALGGTKDTHDQPRRKD